MTNPTNSLHKFPYSNNNWRVWFDEPAQLWRAQRWSGVGATISSARFESNHLRFVNDGRYLRFVDCECKAGVIAFEGSQNITTDCLRLLPRTQAIEVDTIRMSGKVLRPGR